MISAKVALLIYHGQRTGQAHSVPVNYELDGRVVVLHTLRRRLWWRSVDSDEHIQILIAGQLRDVGPVAIEPQGPDGLMVELELVEN